MRPILLIAAASCLVSFLATASLAQTTIEVAISHSNDDAQEDSGGDVKRQDGKIELGQYPWAGFTFKGVAVPQGETILAAKIRFTSESSNSESTALTIFGEDASDPKTFSNGKKISTRTRTSASVAWNGVENWSTGQQYDTPDITAIVQEIVNRSDWSSGSDMAILFRSDDLNGKRMAWAIDDHGSDQAVLVIEYGQPAAPGVFYVRTDGSNSNDGTGPGSGDAWATLAHAVTQSEVTPGSTIHVMPGTYSDQVAPTVAGAAGLPIRVVADTDGATFGTSGDVVLDHSDNPLRVHNQGYWSFEKLKIVGGAASDAGVNADNAPGFVLDRCRLSDSSGDGALLAGTTSATLINCLIYDAGRHGVAVMEADTSAEILNCTIADCAVDGIYQSDGDVTAKNTILAHTGDDCWDQNGGTLSFSNVIEFDYGGSASEGFNSSSNIRADPAFVDRTADNYHLGQSSAAIGAGQDLAEVTVDIRGVARTAGAYDIGAYANALVGWWKLDEASGTTAADSSGNGNDGELYNSPMWRDDGVRGGRAEFTGTAHIRVPHNESLQSPGEVTVTAWIKLHDAGGDQDVLQKGANYALWETRGSSDPYNVLRINGWQKFYYSASSNDFLGRWRHVAFTYDGAQVINYLDGEVDSVYSQSGAIDIDTKWLGIGTNGDWNDAPFQGSIDDARVYNRALSASEILTLFGKVAHWKLDETSGTIATDSSGMGRDGTFAGGVTLGQEGVRKQATQFDGIDAAVTSDAAGDAINGGDAVAIAAWVRPTSLGTSVRLAGNGEVEGYRLDVGSDSRPRFIIEKTGSPGKPSVTAVNALETDRWTQLVGIYDGANLRIYVDGVLDNEVATSGGALVEDDHTFIIGRRNNGTLAFNGKIDDVVVYDRIMTDAEIAQHYGLIGHWKLDEAAGTIAIDSSLMGDDATYVGAPTLGAEPASRAPTGTAVEFDGSTQYVTAARSLMNNLEAFTIAGWIKPGSTTPDRSFFGQNDLVELGIDYNADQIDFWTASGGWLDASHTLPVDSWTHLVATGDGDELRLYVNGVVAATGGWTTPDYGSNSDSFKIGEGVLDPTGDPFLGAMDDVRLYNRAITPDEARALYYGSHTPGVRIIRWVEVANP